MAVKSQQQGGFEYFAASKNKLHGLDCHGNWAGLAFEVVGKEWKKKRGRERKTVCLSVYQLTQKTQSSQILNVSLLEAPAFKCLRYKSSTVIDLA